MFGNQIAGTISFEGDRKFSSFDPTNNRPNNIVFHVATGKEIQRALKQADNSFYQFCNSTPKDRSILLNLIAEQFNEGKPEILRAYCKESGLSIARFEVEFKRTLDQLHMFADYLLQSYSELISETHSEQEKSLPHLMKKRIALGPVLVFGASNFPLAYSTLGGDTVSALAAGCPVIVKAHPFHPETSFIVGKAIISAIKKTTFHPGIFSQLFDDQFEVAQELILDNRIKAVGFTGSYLGGKSLFELANSRSQPIPVFAEMGSSNPVFVFPESLEEKCEEWTTLFSKSITNDAGQFCTKPGLFFVPHTENGKLFVHKLTEKLIKEPSFTMLHPSIHASFEAKKKELFGLSTGELIEKSGKLEKLQGRQGLFITNTPELLQNKALEKEVFGPFAVIIYYHSMQELNACTQELVGQLTATILASEEEIETNEPFIFLLKQRAGRLIFNGVPTGVRVCQSMHHGGPFPASSDLRFTAVGTDSISRFTRPIVYQDNC